MGTSAESHTDEFSINILGDFNIAGETWIIRRYYEEMGVRVISCITGDGRVDDIKRAHHASLNVVQCSGSMMNLAKSMARDYGIPFIRVSYFGLEDMSQALYEVAQLSGSDDIMQITQEIVKREVNHIYPELERIKDDLSGKSAAVYVGGSFKAFSMVKALRHIGMSVAVVGSQTGSQEDYEYLKEICDEGTIIVDDTNPLELSRFMDKKGVDLLIGGVKERPIAYKMGVAFCDHNHERKIPLAGFEGMLHFAREVHASVMSPVWRFSPAYRSRKVSHE